MRRRAGRGELGEFGEKRNWRFFLAEVRAEEDFRFALVSVSVESSRDCEGLAEGAPLEGDILGFGDELGEIWVGRCCGVY